MYVFSFAWEEDNYLIEIYIDMSIIFLMFVKMLKRSFFHSQQIEIGTQDVFDPKDASLALSVRAMADRFCIVDLVKCADDALASFLSEAMDMPGDENVH